MDELDDIRRRLKDVIFNYCDKLGCGNCGLEWEENGRSKCSATELQTKEYELLIKENK